MAEILPIVALASQVKIEHLLTKPEMAVVGLGLVGAWVGSRFFGNFIENRVDASLIDTKRGRVRRGVIDFVDVDTSRLGYNFGRVMAKVLTSDQLWKESTGQRKLFKELWLSKGPHDNQAHFAKTMLNLIHGLRRIERKSGEDVAGLMSNVEYRQKVADLVGLCEILGEVRLVAGKGVQDWYRYGLGKRVRQTGIHEGRYCYWCVDRVGSG